MKNILFVASECVPFIKTGGLADMDPMKASVMVVALCAIGGAYYAYIRRSRRQIAEIDAIEQKMMEEELKD